MNISKTDTLTLIRLLTFAAVFIDANARKPREADKARQIRKLIKKLTKKKEL